jgi:hypothetical protein
MAAADVEDEAQLNSVEDQTGDKRVSVEVSSRGDDVGGT